MEYQSDRPPSPAPIERSHPADRPQTATRSRLPLLLLALVVILGLWFLPRYLERLEYARERGRVQAIRDNLPAFELKQLGRSFGLMAEQIDVSVVHIQTRRVAGNSPFGAYQTAGEGSGVIVDSEGYIVTNNHVIEGAQQISVRMSNGEQSRASVIGADPAMDLAVLKINNGNLGPLVAAEWGDSDELRVGELVWAIGNPFGLERTITFGILSAKGRRGLSTNPEQEFLQTDAAVNPGNSGGPLVDIEGKIIGINTAIIGPRFAGVGFAIPSAIARERYEEMRRNPSQTTVARSGFIGVQPHDVTPQIARELNLSTETGAVILGVVRNSPAAQAGIQPGDVIVRWNDREIQNSAALLLSVARTEIGSSAKVGIIRQGEELTLEVVVAERGEAIPPQE